jgi:hypothetical protein
MTTPDPYTIHAILGGTRENIAFWLGLLPQIGTVEVTDLPKPAPGSPGEVMLVIRLTRTAQEKGDSSE